VVHADRGAMHREGERARMREGVGGREREPCKTGMPFIERAGMINGISP
jgi:hypothetical protein